MKDNEYRCEECEEVFEKGWSEKEAIKEYRDEFGGDATDIAELKEAGNAIVCEDCYKKIMRIVHN